MSDPGCLPVNMKSVLTLQSKAEQQRREQERRDREKNEILAAWQEVVMATYINPVKINAETLTLGCEFEFVMARFRPSLKDKDEKWAKEVVAKALDQPRKASCSGCGQEFECQLMVKVKDQVDDYNYWQVDTDGSLRTDFTDLAPQIAQHFQYFPIEIKSRILRYDGAAYMTQFANHMHWLSYGEEIKFVLNLLHEAFGPQKQGVGSREKDIMSLITTSDTGFHVHIGNGKGTPIPFNVVKRVFSVSLACERQIDSVHSKDRIGGTHLVSEHLTGYPTSFSDELNLIQKTYNRSLSHEFLRTAHKRRWELFTHPDVKKEDAFRKEKEESRYAYDIGSWLSTIDAANDVQHLRELIPPMNKYRVLNVSDCPSKYEAPMDPAERLLTIEFRQHTGTLQADVATSFIDLVASLVVKCGAVTDKEFKSAIESNGILRDVRLSIVDLCKWTECKEPSRQFYERLLSGDIDPVKRYLDLEVYKDAKAVSGLFDRVVVRNSLKERVKQTNQKVVQNHILEKLKGGGYGQFSDADLEILIPGVLKDRLHEHLRLGYRSKVTQELFETREAKVKGIKAKLSNSQLLDKFLGRRANDPVVAGPSSAEEAEKPSPPGPSTAGPSQTKGADTKQDVWW